MPSTAISAQGTTLEIGTATGGAKTITAVTVGNPTIVTSAAHGFSVGDRLTITGVVGLTSLNGSWTITHKTANTYAVALDSTGGTYTSGGTATPVAFTAVANVKSFSGFDGSASEIDTTNLSSTAKEFRLGLVDNGQFTMEIDYERADAGHQALRAKQVAGTIADFRLNLPNANQVTFQGLVKKFSLSGGVDAVLKASVDVKITGAVTGLAA